VHGWFVNNLLPYGSSSYWSVYNSIRPRPMIIYNIFLYQTRLNIFYSNVVDKHWRCVVILNIISLHMLFKILFVVIFFKIIFILKYLTKKSND